MRKKEKLDRQGQAKNLFGSYSPEYQQLIEGINLVLQLSLSTMSPSLPSLDKAIPPVNTQSKIFSQAVKTTASALRYVIKRSFAAFLSSKLDWNASRMARTAPIRGSGLFVSSHGDHRFSRGYRYEILRRFKTTSYAVLRRFKSCLPNCFISSKKQATMSATMRPTSSVF